MRSEAPSIPSVRTTISRATAGKIDSVFTLGPTLPSILSSAPLTLSPPTQQRSGFITYPAPDSFHAADVQSEVDRLVEQSLESDASVTIDLAPDPTQRSNRDVEREELRQLGKCVDEYMRRLKKEAAEDPTGESAELLRKITTEVRRRGMNLDFLDFMTKPWAEKNGLDAFGTMMMLLLVVLLGLGILERVFAAGSTFRSRLRSTREDAPGAWGFLRRQFIRSSVEPPVELDDRSTVTSLGLGPEPPLQSFAESVEELSDDDLDLRELFEAGATPESEASETGSTREEVPEAGPSH